jgi:hypothetical protein
MGEAPINQEWWERDWECLRVVSPAGVWYIVPDERAKGKYEYDKKRDMKRAVFTRTELSILNPVFEALTPEERQKELKLLIDIKATLGGTVESVKKNA